MIKTSFEDEELPDYIMVMLANKRSKEQMTEDLVLFLGANTKVFTEWLVKRWKLYIIR